MIVCPKCGSSLKVREIQEYLVDPETGEANTNTSDYDLTDVLVVCAVCGADVSGYFTNEEGSFDIEDGVWTIKRNCSQ